MYRTNTMKLADVNRIRESQGLAPFAALPTVMRPGKTAKQDKHQKNANAAMRAAANQAMKDNRQRKGK